MPHTYRHRRSSRIAREIPVLLLGSDMEKKDFSERTKTVVVNRYGGGLVSHHRLTPETRITIRCLDTNAEIRARVVGLVEAESGSYTYGVAFLDPEINFWGIDFLPYTESEQHARHQLFECTKCKVHERIDLDELQSDIYLLHHALARSCKRCGIPTVWKQVSAPDSNPPPEPDRA